MSKSFSYRFSDFFRNKIEENEDKITSLKELAVVADNKDRRDREELKLNLEKEAQIKQQEQDKVFEENERKREASINILLIAIALFIIFSAVTDTYDLFDLNSKWTPHFVWVPIVATLICAYFLLRNRKK